VASLPLKKYLESLAIELGEEDINFKREVYIPLNYKSKNISRYFADFIIENKILLGLKFFWG
jgi:GxxExxY protein